MNVTKYFPLLVLFSLLSGSLRAMMSPLHVSTVTTNHRKVATELLREKFALAIMNNRRALIEFFLKAGVQINVPDVNGDTPLHLAWKLNDELIPYLLEQGASIDGKDAAGMTILHRACQQLNVGVCAMLLSHNASTCIGDADGQTPLHAVVMVGLRCKAGSPDEQCALKIIKLLLSRGSQELFYAEDTHKKRALDYVSHSSSAIRELFKLYQAMIVR